MPAPAGPTLTHGQLNRALLARQHLLARVDRPVPATIDHLVGMQAQNPLDPYVALWSRLAGFTPVDLAPLVAGREAVRLTTLRGTIHLHTTTDALTVRPLLQPVMEKILRSTAFARSVDGLDLDALLATARGWVEAEPRNGAQLRALVTDRHPGVDAASVVLVLRYLLPLVQVAPRGVWGETKQATWTTLSHHVGRPLAPAPSAQDLIVRYLAAFGPASVADIASWSRLTGVKALVAPLRDRLVTFAHPDTGRELLDLPDAPRPGAEVPAPVRFLPEYDNVFLGHADRSRIAQVPVPPSVLEPNGSVRLVLVDGMVAGCWTIPREEGPARLVVRNLAPWSRAQRRAVVEEGEALLALLAPDRPGGGVEIVPV